MSIALLCGAALLWDAAALTEPASSPPPQTPTYHYALPLTLALEAATEAIRVCAEHGYRVSATVVDMDGVPQVALRGDGATVHTGESSFEKAFAVVTLGPIFDFDTSGKFFELLKAIPQSRSIPVRKNFDPMVRNGIANRAA